MEEKIKEIEFDILPLNYLDPFKAKKHILYLLSRIKELEEELKYSRISDEDLQKINEDEPY